MAWLPTKLWPARPRPRWPGVEIEHLVDLEAGTYTGRSHGHARPHGSARAVLARRPRRGSRRRFEAPDARPRPRAGRPSPRGQHTLIHAPTGSGKTLAAFLWCLDRLVDRPEPAADPRATRAPSASCTSRPLKALTYDVERNLRAPLAGIALAAAAAGRASRRASRSPAGPATRPPRTAARSPATRRTSSSRPPRSLYLMLTSQAREILRGVEHVIVDEVHAIAGTKRGAHLALSLERLERLRGGRDADARPQRIGLSATQRPLETIARFLGGVGAGPRGRRSSTPARASRSSSRSSCRSRTWRASARSCRSRSSPAARPPAPEACGRASGRRSTRAILELIREHRSTIVFTNSRRLAERLAQRLNELAGEELVRAHHGSIAREQRLADRGGAQGRPAARRSSPRRSLELGIDMGAVDLVIQVESPTSVARGLQRVGRAGHQVGAPEQGRHLPEVPRRPARGRGRDAADARGRDRGDDASRATRSTSSPSRSSR